MSTTPNCGNLHIRTPQTDSILVPNIITQSIVANGMRIGIIPETSLLGEFSYYVIIKNSANNIIFQNSVPINYTGYGNYIYVVINFTSLPNVDEIINIKISSTSLCSSDTNYKVLSYTSSNDTTTVNINGVISKYLKLKPTISYGGYFKDNFYYFKCNSNIDTDDECFIQFKKNTDKTLVLNTLPTSYDIVACPDSSDWVYVNTICLSNTANTSSTTTTSTTTAIPCITGLKLDNIIFKSGTLYTINFTSTDVQSINWKLFNYSNILVKNGNSGQLVAPTFDADFGTLLDGTYTLIIQGTNCSSNITDGTKTFTKGIPSFSTTLSPDSVTTVPTSSGNIGLLADIDIPFTSKWNYFNPDLIPDFTQAKTLDIKSGEMLPNKWAIYHAPYRNLFGSTQSDQLTKMFKKGWTAINATKIGGAFTGMESIITGDRIVVDGGFADTSGTRPEDSTLANFEAFAQTPFGYASTYNIPKDSNGRWRVFLSDIDYESKYTGMDSQASANYHVTAYNSGLSVTSGRYGFMYGSANVSSYFTDAMYNGGGNSIWNLPADGSVKPQYQGKALKDNSRFVGRTEVSYYFESYLPQDYQVKDQNGNNWFKISHFGAVCPAANCGANSVINADSWASQLGSLVEVNYKLHKSYNQDFIMQIKPVNERLDGFKYSQINQQYYDNKYIQEYNRYGTIQSYGVSPIGSEYIPAFIAEAQIFLSYASGAKGISFWSSAFTDTAYPHDKLTGIVRSGAKYDDVNVLNADLDPYIYTMKALWRMNQKINIGNGSSYSFNEICDGTEIYLNESTKVIYPGSSNVTQYRALDWQINKKTPVRAVVNQSKNVVFVLAFQAYGVEQNQITFVLTDYGANISQIIDVPIGKVVVKAFPLTGAVTQTTTNIPPTISSDITNPTVGQTVNLTSSGCSTSSYVTKWYDNDTGNYLATGLVYTITVVNGKSYYAKCINNVDASLSSAKSNVIRLSTNINVFVLGGESNAGTRNTASTLLAGEGGLRTGVRIWNNNTNTLEQLNIGVNNYLDEHDAIPNGWGIENELANLRASNVLNSDFIVIKTAQGGARIGNYNSDITDSVPNYFDKMSARINGVKTALQAEGKTPVFYILYSQGINNATAPTLDDQTHFPGLTGIAYWKEATKLYCSKIRNITGASTKICYMKFFSPFDSYLNGAIQEIVNENANNSFIVTSDLTIQADGLHLDANATKTAGDRYISALGVSVAVPIVTSVTIVQPSMVANYYKSTSGNSEIIYNYQYSTNDIVYLSNDKIKVGLNLRYGGAISYLSQIGSTTNLVNNASDGGRQIQPDYYQKPTNYTQNGKTPLPQWSMNGYNTTLGGDYNRNTATLLDYHTITNGYYIKFKPLLWGFDGELSEITIEVTYTLVGNSIKCDYNYISQRTDAQIPSGVNIVGWSLPTIHLNQAFTKFYSYNGTSPYTNDTMTSMDIPVNVNAEVRSKEFWGAMFNPINGLGVGVYNKMASRTDTDFQFKQQVSGNADSEFSDGFSVIQTLDTYTTPDSNFTWNRTDTAYLIVGTISEIRAKAYQVSGH